MSRFQFDDLSKQDLGSPEVLSFTKLSDEKMEEIVTKAIIESKLVIISSATSFKKFLEHCISNKQNDKIKYLLLENLELLDINFLIFHFPELEELNISRCKKVLNLEHLRRLNKLTCLTLDNLFLENISFLYQIKNLEELHLVNHNNISEINLTYILGNIKTLDLSWCENLTDFNGLEKLDNISLLNITGIKRPDFNKILNLPKLKTLHINDINFSKVKEKEYKNIINLLAKLVINQNLNIETFSEKLNIDLHNVIYELKNKNVEAFSQLSCPYFTQVENVVSSNNSNDFLKESEIHNFFSQGLIPQEFKAFVQNLINPLNNIIKQQAELIETQQKKIKNLEGRVNRLENNINPQGNHRNNYDSSSRKRKREMTTNTQRDHSNIYPLKKAK